VNGLTKNTEAKVAPFLSVPSPPVERQDKVWMGYERKRGKLSDLNAVLRGAL
jgi:hypothetical protein